MKGLRRLGDAVGAAHLWVVGGALRDELLGRPHGDWDLATDLLPEEVMRRVRAGGLKALPTGLQHGTVTAVVEGEAFEVTTFRSEGGYTDGRHPDQVKLGVTLEEDLSRRDFTINALALPLGELGHVDARNRIVDPFGGRQDLAAKLIRAVGDPGTRFHEDGLRPLRACRFAAQLGFDLDPGTEAAIRPCLGIVAKVAVERVQVELTKLLMGPWVTKGLRLLEATGLLDQCLPELRPMVGCLQNRHHRYDVWEHTLRALACETTAKADLRWGLLLHDLGKPTSATRGEDGEIHHFGHEDRSVAMAAEMLRRLKCSHALIGRVEALIRHHGVHPTQDWGDPACRRFLRRLREDGLSLADWTAFRLPDQWAKGWGDAEGQREGLPGEPYRSDVEVACLTTRDRLQALLDAQPPLTAKELALDGRALMALADRPGGPWLGELQRYLLESVLENPKVNTAESLANEAREWLAEST
ncbi:MAG: HD domain-containing protein [Acidobacteria bacterium]|nr:HD domain-containing protein [Acidobacteriota bacterium]